MGKEISAIDETVNYLHKAQLLSEDPNEQEKISELMVKLLKYEHHVDLRREALRDIAENLERGQYENIDEIRMLRAKLSGMVQD